MPYRPKRHGTIYRQKLADLRRTNRQIRRIIERLVQGDIQHSQLYQYMTAITLATVHSDEIVNDLEDFDE